METLCMANEKCNKCFCLLMVLLSLFVCCLWWDHREPLMSWSLLLSRSVYKLTGSSCCTSATWRSNRNPERSGLILLWLEKSTCISSLFHFGASTPIFQSLCCFFITPFASRRLICTICSVPLFPRMLHNIVEIISICPCSRSYSLPKVAGKVTHLMAINPGGVAEGRNTPQGKCYEPGVAGTLKTEQAMHLIMWYLKSKCLVRARTGVWSISALA